MRSLNVLIILLLVISCGQNSESEHSNHEPETLSNYAEKINDGIIPKDTLKGSPKRVAESKNMSITYHSPGVRGRMIWSGLVAYDEVWVTGAHRATTLELKRDVSIQGKKVNAGKYGLFTIPSKEEWVVIINQRWDQHLADEYSETEDILRFIIKAESSEKTPRLTYELTSSMGYTTLSMKWDELKISFDIKQL